MTRAILVAADAIANINAIASAAEAAGDLVVHVRHVHRADGSDAGRVFDFSGESGELGFVAGTEEVDDDPSVNTVSVSRCTGVV
jgi:nicotinamidase-related amidase